MRHHDFGHFDGPVVLFGGPYSNLAALQALGGMLEGRPAICTGDIVGYCAEAVETVQEMQRLGCMSIAGNCERQIALGEADCGCGFEDGSACDLLSKGWYSHALKTCDAATVHWLDGLPELGSFTQQGQRYAVIHGGVDDISRFIWPDSPTALFEEEIAAIEAKIGKIDGVVAGHSGIAFHRQIGGHQWINAGVIGMPPHDGRPQTRFAVLDQGDAVIHRLSYDTEKTVRAMEEAGLTQGYHGALTSGVWPSEDVLPPSLRH